MNIDEFIKTHTHLTNKQMLLAYAKIAYNEGWKNRDGDESIEESIGDLLKRDKWLNKIFK